MRYLQCALAGAGLLAGGAVALAQPPVLEQVAAARPALLLHAAAEATTPGGPLRSAERARYCAQTYPADFYSGWVANRCSKAPYGTRFEYLTSAWRCLCLGHG